MARRPCANRNLAPFSLKHVKRILVIRMGPFGETLLITPVLRALRSSLPHAHITVMVGFDKVDLVSENPNINEVIAYEKQDAELIHELRRHHFHMAVILQPTFRLVLLALIAGIKYRVGFETKRGGKLLLIKSAKNDRKQHETDRYLDVVRAAGIRPVTREIEMSVTEDAQKWARELLIRSGISKERLLIGINPGCFWQNRRWAKERFAEVGDILASEYDAHILITTGPSEIGLGGEIAAMMNHEPVILENTTPMRVAAALKQCALLISNDTGPMHIGIAVGTPTIGLFGISDPNRWGPIASQHAIVRRKSIEAITIGDVMAVARKKIDEMTTKV